MLNTGGGAPARAPEVPRFESPALHDDLERLRPAPADRAFVEELARDGLAMLDLGAQGRALCDQAVAETEAYFDAPGVVRVQDAWLRSGAVRSLARHSEVLRLLRLAYGRRPYPFQTLNFRRGSQQDVHSDAVHFHTAPERFMCGVWIALEDVREEAGPLLYHPGSHRLPILTLQAAGAARVARAGDYERRYLPALHAHLAQAAEPPRPALIRKGQAVVWAANLAHGGAVVSDPASTRRSLVVHCFFEGCLPYTPLTSDVEGGRLKVRLPVNVATGRPQWPRRGARPAWPARSQLVDALGKLVGRRVSRL